ncbi:MAG: thiol peroxidase [Deltaproteobacteria bacterium]|nr:thiol peroxidase [Deltaproteobacteria bacterium]
MVTRKLPFWMTVIFLILLMGCATTQPKIPIDELSVEPGTSVTLKGKTYKLIGKPISVGETIPSVELRDANTMAKVDLSSMRGSVLFLSIVPSLDTAVCEAQTHYLGEEGDQLSPEIKRIVISRDTPFAQKRFAKEAKLTDLQYLSDYGDASFGKSTGLLIDDLMLLARSVILVDREGKVRYIQVVPEITHLPDMERAFHKAEELQREA